MLLDEHPRTGAGDDVKARGLTAALQAGLTEEARRLLVIAPGELEVEGASSLRASRTVLPRAVARLSNYCACFEGLRGSGSLAVTERG